MLNQFYSGLIEVLKSIILQTLRCRSQYHQTVLNLILEDSTNLDYEICRQKYLFMLDDFALIRLSLS